MTRPGAFSAIASHCTTPRCDPPNIPTTAVRPWLTIDPLDGVETVLPVFVVRCVVAARRIAPPAVLYDNGIAMSRILAAIFAPPVLS